MTTLAAIAKSQHPDTKLSPAERMAKLLAFRPGHSHNFAPTPHPAKRVHVASSRFTTA